MTVALTILPPGLALQVEPGRTILKEAHAAGVDITATCGGRGRCTSCRVKFVAGPVPPPTIMDELQLGDALVREGYRLSCQTRVTDPVSVTIAPPLDEATFQILGAERPADLPLPIAVDAGVRKEVFHVELPKEEHRQTSDLDALLAVTGHTTDDVSVDAVKTLPGALRDRQGEVTVTTFGRRLLAVEAGDTALHKFGLAIDIGTTSVVTSLMELESGEQLASVSSLNPQAVFGGDLMSRIAFAQFDAGNLRKLQTRIIGLLNQHVEQIVADSGVLPKWIYKVVIVGNTSMHHFLLGLDPSYVGLAPYAPVLRHPVVPRRARAVPQGQPGGPRVPPAAGRRIRRRRCGRGRPGHADLGHAGAPDRRRHRHERRGAAGHARAPVGVLGPGRAGPRGRPDPEWDARGARRHRSRRARRRRSSSCTRSATPPPRASAGRGSSTRSPCSSTRARSTGRG